MVSEEASETGEGTWKGSWRARGAHAGQVSECCCVTQAWNCRPLLAAHLPAAAPRLEPGNSIKELKFIYKQVTILLELVPPSKAIYGLTGSRKLISLLQM